MASPIEHRELVLALRQALAQAEGQAPVSVSVTPSVVPVTIRTRSRRALVGALGVGGAALVYAVASILAGIAAKRWPAYADLIQAAASAFGGGQ